MGLVEVIIVIFAITGRARGRRKGPVYYPFAWAKPNPTLSQEVRCDYSSKRLTSLKGAKLNMWARTH